MTLRNSAVRLSSAGGLLSPACVAAASVSALALPAPAQGNNKENKGRILDALYLLAALGPPVYVVLLITSVVASLSGGRSLTKLSTGNSCAARQEGQAVSL